MNQCNFQIKALIYKMMKYPFPDTFLISDFDNMKNKYSLNFSYGRRRYASKPPHTQNAQPWYSIKATIIAIAESYKKL